MKRIRLISIKLDHFKGIEALKVDFAKEGATIISGRNGSGKTTIFDAFTWCLFGKDSNGAANFSIKTQDENGEPIHRLEHSVELEMSVDGEPLKVKRTYKEKWVKKRGEAEETFQGHEEARYINDVPFTLMDFTTRIEEIVDYDTFRATTDPFVFLSLSTDQKRATLVEMAGIATDQEIAKEKGFKELANELTTKTIADLTAERKANATRIRQDLKGMPQRIEEASRAIPTDTKESEEELKARQYQLQLDRAKTNNALESAQGKDVEKGRQLLALRGKEMELQRELRKVTLQADDAFLTDYRRAKEAQEELQRRVRQLEQALPQMRNELKHDHEVVEVPTLVRIAELRERFQEVASRKLTITDATFCPTCGAPYSADRIEEIRTTAQEAFNSKQAKEKKVINDEGKALKEKLESVQNRIREREERINQGEEELKQLKSKPLFSKDLGAAPERTEETAKEKRLKAEIESLTTQMNEMQGETESEATKRLRAERDAIQVELDKVLTDIATAQRATAQKARVKELEALNKNLNQALATAEKGLQELEEFQKARMALVEEKVNSLFHTLNWRMYRDQINGGQTEVCEPMIGGVPYADANNAAKVNAGVDICRAIGESKGVEAPIFIDNAESVNEILPTEAQQIHLVVTTGDLTISK